MAIDLYLVVTDGSGANVPGQGAPDKLANPFRGGAVVPARPFTVTAYAFGGQVPTSSTGSPTGRFDVSELVVDMADDSSAAFVFQTLSQNRHLRAVDVLAVTRGERPVVVGGVAVDDAVLRAADWAATPDGGVTRRLTVDGRVFTVGSAYQNRNGSYAAFTSFAFEPFSA